MRRWLTAMVLAVLMAPVLPLRAGENAPASPPPPEYKAPVAQVLSGANGTVQSVNPAKRTFTVVQPSRHRQPPQISEVGVNKDTVLVRNEAVTADMLKVGDTVAVQPQRPQPYGLKVEAEGKVASLQPLTIEVSKEVHLLLAPKAEVVFVRITPMKYDEILPGMDANCTVYRATIPLLAKEVQVFTIAAPAAKQMQDLQQQTPPPPAK